MQGRGCDGSQGDRPASRTMGMNVAGLAGAKRRACCGGGRPARVAAKRPVTVRRCAWGPARWSGWTIRRARQGRQQQRRHLGGVLGPFAEEGPGTLREVWDNTPVHRGEVVREYLGMPGLGLSLVPRLHEGPQLFGPSVQPERLGEPVLPGDPAIKGRALPRDVQPNRRLCQGHTPPWLWFGCRCLH